MDKHHLIELLRKYQKGETTNEENDFLIRYYDLFEIEPDVEVLLVDEEKKEISSEIQGNIWKAIDAKEKGGKKPNAFRYATVSFAAAALFIVICASIIFLAAHRGDPEGFVSISNQYKENRLIHLPDGSTAIVAVGSKIRYPSSFAPYESRELYLEGEAFFDIISNPDKPFIVYTDKLKTTVLGTAFNVKAIPGELEITVTVARGKVRISDSDKTIGLITRGQEVVYDKKKRKSVQKKLGQVVNLDWKKQDLFLDNVTMEDAAKLLEERFGVNIIFSDPNIKENRFTTVFLSNEGIEQVLKSICEFNSARYYYDKQKASITISRISTENN